VVFNLLQMNFHRRARKGATFNGKKIHVSKVARFPPACFCTGFPVRNRKASRISILRRLHPAPLTRASRSAPRARSRLCRGRPLRRLLGINLQKWDTAAGVLLVEEAGGKVSDFAGNPYQLGGPFILATNGLIHEEMRAMALRSPPGPARFYPFGHKFLKSLLFTP